MIPGYTNSWEADAQTPTLTFIFSHEKRVCIPWSMVGIIQTRPSDQPEIFEIGIEVGDVHYALRVKAAAFVALFNDLQSRAVRSVRVEGDILAIEKLKTCKECCLGRLPSS
jgi:hypothetical protein